MPARIASVKATLNRWPSRQLPRIGIRNIPAMINPGTTIAPKNSPVAPQPSKTFRN